MQKNIRSFVAALFVVLYALVTTPVFADGGGGGAVPLSGILIGLAVIGVVFLVIALLTRKKPEVKVSFTKAIGCGVIGLLVWTILIAHLTGTLSLVREIRFRPAHGAVIGVEENIPIYYHRAGHDRRGEYGLEYECVEFVNRWLALHGHRNLSRTGHAVSYFTAAKEKGLTPYTNGESVPPIRGDVIVFSSSGQPYGHVGIVLSTESDGVWVAQQNFTKRVLGNLIVKPIPFEWFALKRVNDTWTVQPRYPLVCLGWSRAQSPKQPNPHPGG